VLVLVVLGVVVVGGGRGRLFAGWGRSGRELGERVRLVCLLLYE
jgi:hypothetical protein